MATLKKSKFGSSFQLALGKFFSFIPLTPNQITVLALLFAIVGFCFATQQQAYLSLLFFILAGLVDAIDGAVARFRKQVTARGAYIDGIIDRLVEFLLVLSLFFFYIPPFILPAALLLIIILFFGSAMTSFATAYAEHRNVADAKKIVAQPGILPRAERLILLFAALALVQISPGISALLIFACALLAVMTFAQRFAYFAQEN